MDIKEIVEYYLKAFKYDGLCGGECGCEIDDLMPCDSPGINDCEPGYIQKHCPDHENRDCPIMGTAIMGSEKGGMCDYCDRE